MSDNRLTSKSLIELFNDPWVVQDWPRRFNNGSYTWQIAGVGPVAEADVAELIAAATQPNMEKRQQLMKRTWLAKWFRWLGNKWEQADVDACNEWNARNHLWLLQRLCATLQDIRTANKNQMFRANVILDRLFKEARFANATQ